LLHQQFADLGRAGEGQLADGRVRGQLAADLVRWPGDAGKDTLWHPGTLGHSHKAKAENGVAVAGFSTIVPLAAKAGPALQVIIAAGKSGTQTISCFPASPALSR
jgi:hypothetical protein